MTSASLVTVQLDERSYPVVVGRNVLDQLMAGISLPEEATKALVVTQQPIIDAGHLAPIVGAFEDAGLDVRVEVVPDGETAKDVFVLTGLWRSAAKVPLSRSDLIIAVGGGVVGDLAGFLAATFNRGISVLQVPTTLLAQVDSSIGGKTGINLPEGKNLVGAFHQPIGVVCDVDVLASLPRRMIIEGLGEVSKYGLIQDQVILELLESSPDSAVRGDPGLMEQLVLRSVAVKAAMVAEDEREGGVRAYLNFGHTVAHAIEALSGYGTCLHGEAVAMGMMVALRLGQRLGRTPVAVVDRAEQLLVSLGLPVQCPPLDRSEVWQVMGRDKKVGPDGVRFVVLNDVGEPVLVRPDRSDVDAVLDELTVT